ncbi:hypothetical protein [Agromyces marinus]|uniref:Uncharacterized protein n=1 Tax=Agromyces marinus TaxID=1389020 RepID=A0ABN6YDA2_9MICO|nr:hypothetical protein [Agromyces marinus]UIP59619.1 hypothetical protein DSM26151_25310 [Agromyces marinus]BDZ55319.1 hypothetical protein GCM10025870_23920 [Agromyces marinus]
MPADEYFEDAVARLIAMPPGDPVNDRSPWGDVPEAERLAWCRALLDFPTSFPGPAIMGFVAQRIRAGGVVGVHRWAWQAAAFHRLGFAASDWYLLRLCIEQRRDALLARTGGRFVVDTQRVGYPSIALIAEDWTDWLPLLRSGITPLRALDGDGDGNPVLPA